MENDFLLKPGLGDKRRLGQETLLSYGVYSVGEQLDEQSSIGSSIGLNYDALVDSAVLTAAPEAIVTDCLTDIPFIAVVAQSSQSFEEHASSANSESVLPNATDELLGNSVGVHLEQSSVSASDFDSCNDRIITSALDDALIPIALVSRLAEDVAKGVLAATQQQPYSIYNFNQAQFSGGFAENVYGSQVGGVINNGNRVSSQLRLFDLVVQDISGIISELPGEYLADSDTPRNRWRTAGQVIEVLERESDLKRRVIGSLRSLEADDFDEKAADPIVNVVLALLANNS